MYLPAGSLDLPYRISNLPVCNLLLRYCKLDLLYCKSDLQVCNLGSPYCRLDLPVCNLLLRYCRLDLLYCKSDLYVCNLGLPYCRLDLHVCNLGLPYCKSGLPCVICFCTYAGFCENRKKHHLRCRQARFPKKSEPKIFSPSPEKWHTFSWKTRFCVFGRLRKPNFFVVWHLF